MQRGLVAGLKASVKNSESLIQLQAKVTRGMATQKDIAKESEKIANNQALLDARKATLGPQLTKRQKTILAQQQQQLDLQKASLSRIKAQNIAFQKSKSLTTILKENAGDFADKIDKTGTLSKLLSGNLADVVTPVRLMEVAILGTFKAMVAIDEQSGKLAKNTSSLLASRASTNRLASLPCVEYGATWTACWNSASACSSSPCWNRNEPRVK